MCDITQKIESSVYNALLVWYLNNKYLKNTWCLCRSRLSFNLNQTKLFNLFISTQQDRKNFALNVTLYFEAYIENVHLIQIL